MNRDTVPIDLATVKTGPVAVWLGAATPARSVRWLDGAIAAAAALATAAGRGPATAIAAGDETWLYLAADRARRSGLAALGLVTKLSLDYLGWAQIAAAAARHAGASTILVDETGRPERAAEVAAIADQLDLAQLTNVVALTAVSTPGQDLELEAVRIAGDQRQICRIRGAAVIGVRLPGPPIDEYPTPTPSRSMRRLELLTLGLDPAVIGHRSLPSRAPREPRRTLEQVATYLALHAPPKRGG